MSESEINKELSRLNCTEIQVSEMASNPELISLSFKEKQQLYPSKDLLELLKKIDSSDDNAPDDSTWYMIERGMEMLQP